GESHEHVDESRGHETYSARTVSEGTTDGFGAGPFHDDVASALGQNGQDVCRSAVRHGSRDDIAVVLVKAPRMYLVDDICDPGSVGLHDTLGRARRAARELNGLGCIRG